MTHYINQHEKTWQEHCQDVQEAKGRLYDDLMDGDILENCARDEVRRMERQYWNQWDEYNAWM